MEGQKVDVDERQLVLNGQQPSDPVKQRLRWHNNGKGALMTRTTIITAAGAFMVLSLMSACNRDQDQTTPAGQQQGQGSAQDYPSTRNMEQPNPAIGGTNSATNKPAPSGNQEPQAGSTTR